MKKIDISTKKYPNTFALVDDCDYEELSKYKWHAHAIKSELLYARRNAKTKKVFMHNEILGRVKGRMVDHRTGETLDNQRHNLRHCTRAENGRNRKIGVNNTSGFKGVSWNKKENKWHSSVGCNGKCIYLGLFTCLMKAARAYDAGAIKYHGEFARCNFQ